MLRRNTRIKKCLDIVNYNEKQLLELINNVPVDDANSTSIERWVTIYISKYDLEKIKSLIALSTGSNISSVIRDSISYCSRRNLNFSDYDYLSNYSKVNKLSELVTTTTVSLNKTQAKLLDKLMSINNCRTVTAVRNALYIYYNVRN